MFVEQKWNILRELSSEPRSPLQLSESLNTSMANISQQLRLLEAANLVGKHKIKNRDKGKPRSMFSLTGDYGYLIAASRGFANKGLLTLDDQKRAILQIWFVKNANLHQPLQQMYWSLVPFLDDIEIVAVVDKGIDHVLYVGAKKGIVGKVQAMLEPFKAVEDLVIKVGGIADVRSELASLRPRSLSYLQNKSTKEAS